MSEVNSSVVLREFDAAHGKRVAFAQLNTEESLNSLTLPMIRILDPQLRKWAQDSRVACVVPHSAGEKAFCAGGDVRALYRSMTEHPGTLSNLSGLEFFAEEYRLDHLIRSYPKPILVWGSGIVMGGGMGLMSGASHRLVTESSRGAMPEISIGLFPDVGISYFLSRMSGGQGIFLALTGASANGHDLIATGLADHFVRGSDRQAIFENLLCLQFSGHFNSDHERLTAFIETFESQAAGVVPPSNLLRHAALIEIMTSSESREAVCASITGYVGEDTWLKRAAASLSRGSPTSVGIVWEMLQRARGLTLAEVFRLDLTVAMHCCARPDFAEGVRALLIDKDQKPVWRPATALELTPAWIDESFLEPSWPTGRHPLADLN